MSRETDLAWLAGMIDGEGHIGVGRHLHRQNERFYYKTILSVTGIDRVGIDRCLEIAGRGAVYPHTAGSITRRPSFMWGARGPNVGYCLELVLPYLVMKGRQAELAIRATRLMGRRGLPVPHRDELEKIYQCLKDLHWGRPNVYV